jgi:hypothetical protein
MTGAFDSWWTCDDKNLSEFEHMVAMMHGRSSWMLREEEAICDVARLQQELGCLAACTPR